MHVFWQIGPKDNRSFILPVEIYKLKPLLYTPVSTSLTVFSSIFLLSATSSRRSLRVAKTTEEEKAVVAPSSPLAQRPPNTQLLEANQIKVNLFRARSLT